MYENQYSIVKASSSERADVRRTRRRLVTPVWDGEEGVVHAVVVDRRAGTEEIVMALQDSGVDISGIMGMDFPTGKTKARFILRETCVAGLVDFAPLDERVERMVKPVVVDDERQMVVLRVQPGIKDEQLLGAARAYLDNGLEGIIQDKALQTDRETVVLMQRSREVPGAVEVTRI